MSSSQIAENYQLKWHSHLTNLNSSVATLYRNDKFADVLLFTSQSDGGCGIPAHKIILSSCSHFFASVFESNPTPPNSMVYIVLPPELSKRSIQILIQYMYSGEATVSNDILNEVLHGGELLKIRGLWRNKTPSNESNNSTQYMPSAEAAKSTKGIDNDGCLYGDKPMSYEHPVHERNANNLSIIKESPVIVTSPTHLSAAAPHHRHQASPPQPPDFLLKDRRKFCCVTNPPDDKDCSDMSHPKPSSHNEMISSHLHPPPPPPLPPPPPPSLSVAPPQTIQLAQSHSTHELQQQQHNSSIIVKKELAIIANDNMAISSNIPASHYGLVSLQLAAAAVKKAQSPPILKPRNKTSVLLKQRNKTDSFIEKTQCGYQPPDAINENGNAQYEQQISRRYSDDSYLYGRDANDVPSGSHHHHHHHRGTHEVDHTIRHADKSRSIAHLKQQRPMTQHSIETMVEINVPVRKTSMNEQPPTPNPTPDTIRMMSIKQEPVEWTEFEHDNNLMEKSNIEVNVKPELVYSKDGSDGEDAEMQEPIYSPLTCELCSETFTIPADWVRHIESHSEPATHCVPKKRKRIEENLSENTAALRCDLCSMYFVTPAEWVRHVQNMHTETELALSNNNATLRRTPVHRSTKHMDSTSTGNDRCTATAQNLTSEKSCVVCKKMFPSYASMIIHKRTHTDKYQ